MEVALYQKITDPVGAIERLGKYIGKSGMFGCNREEQGQVIAMTCLCENISPVDFMRTYDVMHDGKIRKKALAALAEFRKRGGSFRWLNTGNDGKAAELELTMGDNKIVERFTIEDARRQGLIKAKGNWEKDPATMLRARCASRGIAMIAPEIYAGDTDDEESNQKVVAITLPGAAHPGTTPEPSPNQQDSPQPAARESRANTDPASTPIEAEIVKESEAELAAAGLAPVQSADPETLPQETVDKLTEIMGNDLLAANKYLIEVKRWLRPGETPEFLSAENAGKIIAKAGLFMAKVREYAAQKGAKAA